MGHCQIKTGRPVLGKALVEAFKFFQRTQR